MSNMIADIDTIMIVFVSGYYTGTNVISSEIAIVIVIVVVITFVSGYCTDTNMIIIVSEVSYGAISYHNTRNVISYHTG